jgi:hypothetical protein
MDHGNSQPDIQNSKFKIQTPRRSAESGDAAASSIRQREREYCLHFAF